MEVGIDRWKGLFGGEDGNDLGIAGLRGRASQEPCVDLTLLLWFATVVFKISVKIAKPHDLYYPIKRILGMRISNFCTQTYV